MQNKESKKLTRFELHQKYFKETGEQCIDCNKIGYIQWLENIVINIIENQ